MGEGIGTGDDMRVGFIGLGNIGKPMATNLAKAGFALAVHDLVRAKADSLIELGATWVGSPREAAEGAEVVVTSLPGPPEVRQALEGERGVIAGVRRGATWIEMSTTEIAQLKRLAATLAERGAGTLESPVTGGVVNAWNGKVTMLVAGERAEFDKRLPVLRGIGDKVFYLGPLGNGMVTKLITNMLCFVHQAALGEGLILGKRAGIDLVELWSAIKASYGNSFVCETDVPRLFNGTYDPSFVLDLVCKDARLFVDQCRAHDVPAEVSALVEQICNRARVQYGGDKGNLHTVKLLEDATGVSLRATLP